VFRAKKMVDAALQIASLILSKHREWNQVEHFQASRLEIHTATPLPVQLDGDPCLETPVVIETVPMALKVLGAPPRTGWFKEEGGEGAGEGV
jgi:diacylglycerol kinase family enzyme